MRQYNIELSKQGRGYHQITRKSVSNKVVSIGWNTGILAMCETLKDLIFCDQIRLKQ